MTTYLLSVHSTDTDSAASAPGRNPAEMEALMAKIGALEDELHAADALLFSGKLQGARLARVVRAGKGRVVTTDGPFVEAKEQIAGFYIIRADGPEAAQEWAAKTSEAVGAPIELRPFADVAIG